MGSEAWTAARLGEKGGRVSTPSKAAAARENGRLGARPRSVDIAHHMPTSEFFIERRDNGQYRVLKPNAQRASAIARTQKEAVARQGARPGRRRAP
jgi:hypothetical protein